jgi:hypothetical protein
MSKISSSPTIAGLRSPFPPPPFPVPEVDIWAVVWVAVEEATPPFGGDVVCVVEDEEEPDEDCVWLLAEPVEVEVVVDGDATLVENVVVKAPAAANTL